MLPNLGRVQALWLLLSHMCPAATSQTLNDVEKFRHPRARHGIFGCLCCHSSQKKQKLTRSRCCPSRDGLTWCKAALSTLSRKHIMLVIPWLFSQFCPQLVGFHPFSSVCTSGFMTLLGLMSASSGTSSMRWSHTCHHQGREVR